MNCSDLLHFVGHITWIPAVEVGTSGNIAASVPRCRRRPRDPGVAPQGVEFREGARGCNQEIGEKTMALGRSFYKIYKLIYK